MGAVTSPLAKLAGKELTEEILPSVTRSMEHVFSKIPEGIAFVQRLKTEWEPELKKQAQQFVTQNGWTHRDALDISKRMLRPSHFGSKDQAMSNLIVKAEAKRGPVYANTIADHLNTYFHEYGVSKARVGAKAAGVQLGIHSPVSSSSPIETIIRKGTSAVSTGRIAIPHLSQPLNLIFNTNYESILKGIGEYASHPKDARRLVETAGGMFDELMYEARSSKWYRNIVQPGFNSLRKQQIVMSGVVGKHSALDAAERLMADPTNKYANVQLHYLGIKPSDVLAQGGKLTDDQIDKAIYRMIDETMFLRSGLRTPAMWERNAAFRIGTMYKHFAFTEAKLLKDGILRSAKQGPASLVRTISALAILFPAAGEGIKQLENLATNNTDDPDKRLFSGVLPDGLNRYIDDIAHMGGLGIGYQMIRSMARHQLGNYVLGPFFGGLTDLTQDAWLALTKHNTRSLERDTLKKVPVVGPYLTNKLLPPKQSLHVKRNRKQRRNN